MRKRRITTSLADADGKGCVVRVLYPVLEVKA